MDRNLTMIRRLGLLALAIALAGCAHPITLTPDNHAIAAAKVEQSPRNVGYYLSAENRDKEFVTLGGGGDKVSHHPYRDLEPGLYLVLSNVFANVTSLKSANDAETIRNKNISFVFVPTVVPASSSDGVLTWPPTNFSINIDCVAYDATGKQIAVTSVQGLGLATFSEFTKMGYGLAGQRAATDALLKLQDALGKSPEFK
jgi:hypothetical protein